MFVDSLFLIKYFIDRKFIALINSIILITVSLFNVYFYIKISGVLVDSKINYNLHMNLFPIHITY